MLDATHWTEKQLEQHSLDPQPVRGLSGRTLTNDRIGESSIAYNASGLSFTLLTPNRGLEHLVSTHHKGIPLTLACAGFAVPARLRPGLDRAVQRRPADDMSACRHRRRQPEKDDVSGEQRDLHGRYSRTARRRRCHLAQF